jgi:hypothetical protein
MTNKIEKFYGLGKKNAMIGVEATINELIDIIEELKIKTESNSRCIDDIRIILLKNDLMCS